MANYFDNQNSWSWSVTDNKATITTDHGTHTHTLDLTNTTIGDLAENTGQVMGDAHRAASHDFKDENEVQSANTLESTQPGVVDDTINAVQEPSVQDDSLQNGEDCSDGLDGGEDCDDGLDV